VDQLEEEAKQDGQDRQDKSRESKLFLYPVHPVHPVNSFLYFKLNHYPGQRVRERSGARQAKIV
jgi:hypothetical protein